MVFWNSQMCFSTVATTMSTIPPSSVLFLPVICGSVMGSEKGGNIEECPCHKDSQFLWLLSPGNNPSIYSAPSPLIKEHKPGCASVHSVSASYAICLTLPELNLQQPLLNNSRWYSSFFQIWQQTRWKPYFRDESFSMQRNIQVFKHHSHSSFNTVGLIQYS